MWIQPNVILKIQKLSFNCFYLFTDSVIKKIILYIYIAPFLTGSQGAAQATIEQEAKYHMKSQ